MADKQKPTEANGWVSIPPSEWAHIDRWLGSHANMSGLVLSELSKIKQQRQHGPRCAHPVGVRSVDAMIGGVSDGEVLYLGSETEDGNFAFCLNIIKRTAIDGGQHLLVFNCGRGEYAYARGLLGLCADTDEGKLRRPQQLTERELVRLEAAAERIGGASLSLVSIPNLCVETLCQEVEERCAEERPDMILVDNLRLMTSHEPCADRQTEYRVIAGALWRLAKDSGIPIVVTGPLSKQRRTRNDYWPTACDMPAEDMLDSFDKIVMVHRCRETPDEKALTVTVVKNPEGPYGYRKIEFNPLHNRLTELVGQGDAT